MAAKSVKTTLGGVGSILSAIVMVIGVITGDVPLSMATITAVIGLISAGYVGLTAKDSTVTGIGLKATTDPQNDATKTN